MKLRISKPLLIPLAAVLVISLAVAAVCLLDPLDCRMAEGVTVGGKDLSGMTYFQAVSAMKDAARETVLKEPLDVELPEQTLSLQPEAANLRLSYWKAGWDAYMVGRGDASEADIGLSSYISYDKDYLEELLNGYAAKYDTTLTQPSWKLRGQVPELGTGDYEETADGQTVELTLGLPERQLDVEAAREQILRHYDQGFAGMKKLTLEVEPKQLPQEPNLQEIYDTTLLTAKDDSLDMEKYEVIYGSYGYRFNQEKAKEMIAQADYGDVLSIPMEAYEPEIFGDGVYFRDVLGDCETKHSDDENRNTNLRLVCQFLDGLVIQPGEEFSYNMAVGERTEERGFKPATVFAGDRKTKDFGGGVCQGSTTLYNCLLEADMEITERHGHGALVTYIPLGLDAAVNWLTKTDLMFINNSHFPVMIRAEVSDGYMKMKLLGTDEKDYYIEMEANSYLEGDYYYAGSYKCKYDKQTKELISRDREAFSSYIADLPG